MKIKIFTLIIALVCFSMIFVACNEQEPCTTHVDENTDAVCDVCTEKIEQPEQTTEEESTTEEVTIAPCEEHKDDDADKLCDVCARAIVVITQPATPPEEESRVDMIVNKIPENVDLPTYINTTFESPVYATGATAIDGYTTHNGEYVITKIPSEDGTYNTYKVYNLITGHTVCETTDNYIETLGGSKSVNATLTENYVTLMVRTVTPINNGLGSTVESISIKYYSYANIEAFCTIEWSSNNADGKSFEESYTIDQYTRDGIEYIVVNDTVYAIDTESKKCIYTGDKKTLVHRPEFDFVVGDLGYRFIYEQDLVGNDVIKSIYVYDLTKWIECVYSYTIPSYYENAGAFLLDNGNVLVTGEVSLLNNATSYDVISYSSKYDLVYTIVDVTNKKATDVEFGYYIDHIYSADADERYTETAVNIARVYPIVNDRVDMNAPMTLVVDNELKVLYNCDSVIDITNCYLTSSGLFLHVGNTSDGYAFSEIINASNERVTYVPDGGAVYPDHIRYDGKIYDHTMKLLLDVEASGYSVSADAQSYLILYKVNEVTTLTEYYYYSVGMESPVKLEGVLGITYASTKGFQTMSVIEVEGEAKTVYTYYGANNVKLFESESIVYSADSISSDGAAQVVATLDGKYYIAK